jgi:hypothetical protein
MIQKIPLHVLLPQDGTERVAALLLAVVILAILVPNVTIAPT